MKTNSIGFIGGGRITKIFLQGFKNKWVSFESVKVYEPNHETIDSLEMAFPEIEKAANIGEVANQKLIIIAVHPPIVMEVLKQVKQIVTEKTIVVSLAPKITLGKMASVLPTKKLARMIPNATSFINEGFNPISFHSEMDEKEKKQIRKLFKPLGKTFETEEEKLESYAIVSAMLPTYFWFQWLEIERIAKETGLSVKEARKTVKSTMSKAIKLYYNSGLTPSEVMDLIPVKPIGMDETQITDIFDTRLMGLWGKIKP
ncbi:MAG TPA: NAD(P)-binding domain-containing protein [Draconibacterium sp.]|nr:NAD(P)-binding domain-containing protein [Draconibacterium sp.]